MSLRSIIQKSSAQNNVLLMISAPVLLALYLSATSMYDSYTHKQEMQTIETSSRLATYLSALIHQLQIERGMTAGFMGEGGEGMGPSLVKHRLKVNGSSQDLKDFWATLDLDEIDEELAEGVTSTLTTVQKIGSTREAVDTKTIALPKAIAWYTDINRSMITTIKSVARLSTDDTSSKTISAYVSLIQGKELAGIERAVGVGVLAKNEFSTKTFIKFTNLIQGQTSALTAFRDVADPQAKALFDEKMTQAITEGAQVFRNTLMTHPSGTIYDPFIKQNAKKWFGKTTARINTLKEIEDGLATTIISRASAEVSSASMTFYGTGIVVTILFGITGLLCFIVLGQISSAIQTLETAGDAIASGQFDLIDGAHGSDLPESTIAMVSTVRNLVNETQRISTVAQEGNLQVRGDTSIFQGAYKDVIEGFNNTLIAVVEPINEAMGVIEAMADGNLSEEMVGNYHGEFSKFKIALNRSILAMNKLIKGVAQSTNSVENNSRKVAQSSMTMAQSVSEQAASLEEVSAALEEMGGVARKTAESASQAQDLANHFRNTSNSGKQEMDALITAMNDIEKSSSDISKVLKLIETIAFQTDLLALNAAVEAARAGAHGRGFAVVADEVRALASRSASAVQQTNRLVTTAVRLSSTGSGLARRAVTILSDIADGSEAVSEHMDTITKSIQEQARGVTQVSEVMSQLDIMTQANAASSEETSSVAQELNAQVGSLRQLLSQFELQEKAPSAFNENAPTSMENFC